MLAELHGAHLSHTDCTAVAGTGFCPVKEADPGTDPTRKDPRAEVTASDKARALTTDFEELGKR